MCVLVYCLDVVSKFRSVFPMYFGESLLCPFPFGGYGSRMFCVVFLARNVALVFEPRNNFVIICNRSSFPASVRY
jgi:hypothetical protein